ncbi:MAG TPA: serine hydrolase [Chitinophagaceae bacterium]|nr:serine hydrolase [Chitinophagaceae bacterium]
MNISGAAAAIILILLAGCKTPVKMGSPQAIETERDSTASFNGTTHALLVDLLKQYPDYFQSVTSNPDNKVQIIYTQIDRRKSGKPRFTDHYFNVNDSAYFYPASTVKLPVAILALEKLNDLKIPGLNKSCTMITEADHSGQTEVYNDPSAPDGRPTIEHYIKKILLVSDNDAFNRLYEFLGQEYINNTLHKKGYEDAQIIHRLEISLSEDENRHTNPVRFFDTSSKLIYEKPLVKSKFIYAERNTKMGTGFYRRDGLVNEPFDFSKKNRLTLRSLHSIVRSVMFPNAVAVKQRFKLRNEDYEFLRKYMSMMPSESGIPVYQADAYWDTYVKFLLYGTEKNVVKDGVRIFNKVGDAYGFLIDAAYFADYNNHVEFMLSAVIHCNSDGIFNDDKYDYDSVGLPFMKHLGQLIYDHELKRKKKVIADLSKFRFNYTQ